MAGKYLVTADLTITISFEAESKTEGKIRVEMQRLLIAKILHEAGLSVTVQ